MKVISCFTNEFINKLKIEKNIAFSQEAEAFIMTDETYGILDKQYNFHKLEDETEGNVFSYDSLESYLDAMWEDKSIEIPLVFTYPKKININLIEDTEIAAEPYEKHNHPDQEQSISELLKLKDWYSAIAKNTKQLMLQLFLDSTKMTLESMINNLESIEE